MIPSKPMTTCSPKRTGIETCYWTRPGRSSRGRSAAIPARRRPRIPTSSACCASCSGLGTASRRAQAGAGGCAAVLGGVLGYRRGAEGGAPLPWSPRTCGLRAGRWGRRRAGLLGAGDPGHPAAAARSPRGQGAGAVLLRLGLSPRIRGCCSGSIFPSLLRPLAASPDGVRWQRPSWSPWARYLEGASCIGLRIPARTPRGKQAPEGLAVTSRSAWRWTC